MAPVVKNRPINAGNARDMVRTLGWKDFLKKEMVTHSNILAWRIPQTKEPQQATVPGVTKSQIRLFVHARKGCVNKGRISHLKINLAFSSVAQSCLTLCDPMNRSTPGLPVHHQLLEFTQTHIHRVSDAIQP